MPSIEITPYIAAIAALLQVIFIIRVSNFRLTSKISLGEGSDEEMQKRVRGHGNFIETVPIALILILLLEIQGTSHQVLMALGGTLIAARVMHYLGVAFLPAPTSISLIAIPRLSGMMTTVAVILISAIILLTK